MATLMFSILGLVALVAACTYGLVTRPCRSGFHQHRHWRFRHSHHGGHHP